jgi:O-antigen ligase
LELYITNVQQILFGTFMFLSFLTLLIFLVKRKFLKALLGFLLPLLIYLLVNFIFESILYASESLQVVEELTREELTLRNIVLGIDDLKVVLTIHRFQEQFFR